MEPTTVNIFILGTLTFIVMLIVIFLIVKITRRFNLSLDLVLNRLMFFIVIPSALIAAIYGLGLVMYDWIYKN